jgi:hypothetical protein
MRTVFVLGAGFSGEASLPMQSEILGRLRVQADILAGRREETLLDIPGEPLGIFAGAVESAMSFVTKVFGEATPTLEDVFTLLDQSVAKREDCVGVPWQQLDYVREQLKTSILIYLHASHQRASKGAVDLYRRIGAHLLAQRLDAEDSVSVISLNWDTLLEDSVYWCIERARLLKKADIDYACASEPLGPRSPHRGPADSHRGRLHQLRVIKPHGSVNWLSCPSCNRLFTGLGSPEDVWAQYCLERECPRCAPIDGGSPVLRSLYVTPTFLKSFENLHLQNVWHAAYLELSGAERVVFVGYSLPDADYHLRALFKRAIRRGVEVACVLRPEDMPGQKRIPSRYQRVLAGRRYEEFFGSSVRLIGTGLRGFVTEEMKLRSLPALLRRLEERGRKSAKGPKRRTA